MAPMLCLPEGLLRVRVMSGTPDTLEVKAMVPFANAASGLPEGASVTESVSTTSAYISLDVWRTLARLQGRAGVFALDSVGMLGLEFAFDGVFLSDQSASQLPSGHGRDESFVPWQVDAPQELAHPPLRLDNLSQGVGLGGAYGSSIAHLDEELGDDIVVVLDLDGEERGANELLERIDDTVQELEHQQRLDLGGGCREVEEVRVREAEDEGRWVCAREVDEVRSGRGVL